jgi:hypothetical protein
MEKYENLKGKIPGPVISAIEQFLRFGDETYEESHNGYYSTGGWPYEVLKEFVSKVNKGETTNGNQNSEPRNNSLNR